jgi:hypothetical protein
MLCVAAFASQAHLTCACGYGLNEVMHGFDFFLGGLNFMLVWRRMMGGHLRRKVLRDKGFVAVDEIMQGG